MAISESIFRKKNKILRVHAFKMYNYWWYHYKVIFFLLTIINFRRTLSMHFANCGFSTLFLNYSKNKILLKECSLIEYLKER